MESRRQGDLQWLQHLANGLRTTPANHLLLPFSSGDGDSQLSPSFQLNRSHDHQFTSSGYDPYYPNPAAMHNTTTTTANNAGTANNPGVTNSTFLNPSYPDSFLYDLLANRFNQLSLSSSSSTHHQSPVNNAPARFGSVPFNENCNFSYYDPHGSNGQFHILNGNYGNGFGNVNGLQGMRVDSAVRGLYFQPDDTIWNNSHLRQHGYSWNTNDSIIRSRLGYSGRNRVIRERSFDTISSSSSTFGRNLVGSQQNFSYLEELRGKIFTNFEELRGKIFIVANDQNGCRDLQKVLGEEKPKEKEMIYSELKNHVRELMVEQFANYLAQKMFEVADEDQITELVVIVVSEEHKLMDICLDTHGTRAMQKLLGKISTDEQRSLVVSALRRITVTLTKNSNGHHVIEHCLKYFPNENKTHILRVVADNCIDIAMDKSGCCVLQQCVEHARGDPRDRLVSEIVANAFVLSEHSYGNYVVQFLVGLKIPQITHNILAQLVGNFVSLSMNKYGSNVVEKCMKEASEKQAMQIIREIIDSPHFLTLLQDPYGNYVAQSALSHAKGPTRHHMMNLIQMHYSYLHSHPHGKRVLAKARESRQRV